MPLPDDLRRRVGWFEIEEFMIYECPDKMMEFFRNIIVLQCERLWDEKKLEYMALCPDFYPVPKGCLTPPTYRVWPDHKAWLNRSDNSDTKFFFQRED